MTDELDHLIAEKVMGWTLRRLAGNTIDGWQDDLWDAAGYNSYNEVEGWHPSTSVAQAFEALEKWMYAGDRSWTIEHSSKEFVEVLLTEIPQEQGWSGWNEKGKSIPMTICTALAEAVKE